MGILRTMKRLSLAGSALLAIVATLVVDARLPHATRATSAVGWTQPRSAAKQLPAGFVLPSSDVDLTVSSLVAADLDADGDLDIVAAAANGSPDIVVWVNDGEGRLTRKLPELPKTLGAEPPAPTVDQRSTTVFASIQSASPAVQTICANAWLALAEQRCRLPLAPSAISATLATLRSRSPPVLS